MKSRQIPLESYGVSFTSKTTTIIEEKLEELNIKGFCVLKSGYDKKTLNNISQEFDYIKNKYEKKYKDLNLKKIKEHNTVRLPLAFENKNIFKFLALNKTLLELVSKAIQGKFILNQQNGIINPPRQEYNQGKWHRDLPYQHFVSSKPLALNALFCIDDFTLENGSTLVLQGSHKAENFPSEVYIKNNAFQITAKRGSFIVLDCMLFHSGGKNLTKRPRRAVNHVYTIPFFKQQISIPKSVFGQTLSLFEKEIFGFPFAEPGSVENYLKSRGIKKQRA